mgnify:CR=1 FL=1
MLFRSNDLIRAEAIAQFFNIFSSFEGGLDLWHRSKPTLRQKNGKGVGFERIRRITGYLVGTLDRFNDAKRAEEHDRVKHGMQH